MGPLSDLGMSSGDDKVTVEHLLVLGVSKTLEEPLRKALVMWGESSTSLVRSMKVLGYAAATYLVLTGFSRFIDSLGRSRRRLDDDKE